MLGWRPVYGHPAGPSPRAWFVVLDDGAVFPTDQHPEGGAAALPWFTVADPLVYRAEGHPHGPSADASYRIIGSFVYLAEPAPDDERAPWYQIVPPG